MDKRELLCDRGLEDAVVFDSPDYDDAIIGVTHDDRVVYSYPAMVRILQERDEMTEEEAQEFIDYNTIRAIPYGGENPPVVMYPIEEEGTESAIERLEELIEKYDRNREITDTDLAHVIEILKGRE